MWDPRPSPSYSDDSRRDYYAGYSDGYHGYHRGAGGLIGNGQAYETGYVHGTTDSIKG